MPYIMVNMLEGKTMEQKKAFVRDVTMAAVNNLGVEPHIVTVVINEIKKTNLAKGGVFRSEKEKQ